MDKSLALIVVLLVAVAPVSQADDMDMNEACIKMGQCFPNNILDMAKSELDKLCRTAPEHIQCAQKWMAQCNHEELLEMSKEVMADFEKNVAKRCKKENSGNDAHSVNSGVQGAFLCTMVAVAIWMRARTQ